MQKPISQLHDDVNIGDLVLINARTLHQQEKKFVGFIEEYCDEHYLVTEIPRAFHSERGLGPLEHGNLYVSRRAKASDRYELLSYEVLRRA